MPSVLEKPLGEEGASLVVQTHVPEKHGGSNGKKKKGAKKSPSIAPAIAVLEVFKEM